MAAIHIQTTVTPQAAQALPALKLLVGQRVDIVVTPIPVADWETARKALKGSILWDDDPFAPAAPPEDWEALA